MRWLLPDRQVVGAANAGPGAAQVRSIDVERDRGRVGVVADAVDVTGRGERRDGTGWIDRVRNSAEVVAVVAVDRLLLGAAQHGDHAPGEVVVDRGLLARSTHERDHREQVLGMQDLAHEALGIAAALGGGEQVKGRRTRAKRGGDPADVVSVARLLDRRAKLFAQPGHPEAG